VSSRRAGLVIVLLGLLTFGVTFTLLEFSRSQAAPAETLSPPPEPTAAPAVAFDSFARTLQGGKLAVGVPISGSETLLRDVQPGDRLDVLASLSGLQDAQPVTAVVVRGATVLRSGSAGDPLLLAVAGSDAIALAHLVLGGTHLGYVLWPTDSSIAPLEPRVLDQRTARTLLGLTNPTPTAAPTESAPPTPATLQPRNGSGFLYQVQPGDTWDSVATLFGISVSRLRDWNEASTEDDPVPGRLLFIPRGS